MKSAPPDSDAVRVRSARIKLLWMFLIPLAAIAAAYLVLLTGIGLPESTTNRGQLLQPAQQLGELSLRDANGTALSLHRFAGTWLMLLPGTSHCDEPCSKRLWLTRQVRRALGKNASRVQRVYLALDASPDDDLLQLFSTEHADLQWLGVSRGRWGSEERTVRIESSQFSRS